MGVSVSANEDRNARRRLDRLIQRIQRDICRKAIESYERDYMNFVQKLSEVRERDEKMKPTKKTSAKAKPKSGKSGKKC